jgi:hypothetical protein
MDYVAEKARQTPVVHEADICILGGSCTGVFAAVRAARLGARVAVVERNGFFGGSATAGLVTVWHSAFDMEHREQIVAGLTMEVLDRLKKRDSVLHQPSMPHQAYVFNPEELKIELDELVAENQIRPFLHTRFVTPAHENGRIRAAVIEDKSGRRAIAARYFIDATGDGDLIARMGLPFAKYDELQPPTTVAIFDNFGEIRRQNEHFDLMAEVHDPRYENALKQGFLWGTKVVGRPEAFMVAGTRAHNADCSEADALTDAEIECRRQVRAMGDILREHVRGAENLVLANLSSCIGIRETRHAECRHCLTAHDILNGVAFDDAIGYGTYGIDIHHSNKPGITIQYLDGTQCYTEPGRKPVRSRWRDEAEGITPYYQIPYRSLVPVGAQNVLVAGRLIGADKQAYGAIRVMINCNQTGEAAGVACALALGGGLDVPDVPAHLLRKALHNGGSAIL